MIVRNPTATEVERAVEVAGIAFSDVTHEQLYTSFNMIAEVFGRRFILVVEDEGQIVSTLVCQPTPVYINGGLVPHASTGAVATIPEARNKGCAGAMMTECVRILRDENVYLSSLWPFSFAYYRKFGWEIGAEVLSYGAAGKVFAELGDAGKSRGAQAGDFEQLKLVYDDWAQNYNCLTKRSDQWWNRVLNFNEPLRMVTEPGEDRGVIVHKSKGGIDGYLTYRVTGDAETKAISVTEIAFTNPQDRRDMLALAGSIVGDGNVTFGAPMGDLFLQEVPNPRLFNTNVHASFQFRVIDPRAAMEVLTLDDDVSGKVTFSISDPVFKHGWEFGVAVEDGEVAIVKPDPKRKLEMDVQTFARLYSGYLSAYDALELGKIELKGDAMEMLLAACVIFSPLTPYRSGLEPG